MSSPLGKMRYALAFLFVVLAANFLAAQAVIQNSQSGNAHPDGKGGVVVGPEVSETEGAMAPSPANRDRKLAPPATATGVRRSREDEGSY